MSVSHRTVLSNFIVVREIHKSLIAFLLLPVPAVAVLELPRSRINSSAVAQNSTLELVLV